MRTKNLLIVVVLISVWMQSVAQNVTRPESYNYQRGVEAYRDEQYKTAMDFFEKEVKDNPKNGYAYSWMASINEAFDENGQALTNINQALKFLPKKDLDYMLFAYSIRSNIYLALEDTVKALDDIGQIIRLMPKDTRGYEKRGNLYYQMEKYDLSDVDYKKMTELEPGETMGYMGLGRNANARKDWDGAMRLFDYVMKLSSDYSQAYAFRAEAYLGKEMWNEGTDDIVSALKCDMDRKAIYLATNIKNEQVSDMLVAKMKVQMAKSPNSSLWPMVIAAIYDERKEYRKAIDYLEKTNKVDASDAFYYGIAKDYIQLGEYDSALTNIEQAINMDSTDVENLYTKANILYELGDTKAAIAQLDKVLEKDPEMSWGYYRRGWFKEIDGDPEGAIEDLTTCVVLNPKLAYAYQIRGRLYQKMGKQNLAESDFKKIIELETKPEDYECIFYAYHGLGEDVKAIETYEAYLANDTTEAGKYYDGACLYSLLQNKEKALYYLEECLKHGYARFAHIERDDDMDFIRNTEEYKVLLERYQKTAKEHVVKDGRISSFESNMDLPVEIPFTKEGGVCQVKCKINDLPLYFVFDTGASTVSLSMVEATFMMKNGYLKPADIIGKRNYMDANGNVSEGTEVNLRNVDFGGEKLTNVRASVVRNQQAPLLLGQSVLGRLGKIEIDNEKRVLKLKK